jgi:hypothetical protein
MAGLQLQDGEGSQGNSKGSFEKSPERHGNKKPDIDHFDVDVEVDWINSATLAEITTMKVDLNQGKLSRFPRLESGNLLSNV